VSEYFFYGGRTLDFPIATEVVDLNLHRAQGGARLLLDRVGDSRLDATVGFDYDNIFGTDQRWQNVGGAHGSVLDDGYFSVPNLGAYSQIEWRPGNAGVTAGLRYDQVRYRFESNVSTGIPQQGRKFGHVSPRLSAVWTAAASISLYASAGRGVEVPAIGELSARPGARLSSLHPKSLWNYEVGARRIVGDRTLLTGSVFYADVRGEFVPRTINNVSRPENAGRSRNLGLELAATARATGHADFSASYSFLDLRLLEYTTEVLDSTGNSRTLDFGGQILPGVPKHRLTGEARVHPRADLDLGVQVEWQSIVYVESSNATSGIWYFWQAPNPALQHVPFRAVPSRALVHLNAAWRRGPATLFGNVENLFRIKHAANVQANEIFGRFYESGPPASVSFGIRVTTHEKHL
jgi:iron complex outermembrane receptor protein